jgi:HK97 family phage prohead protease
VACAGARRRRWARWTVWKRFCKQLTNHRKENNHEDPFLGHQFRPAVEIRTGTDGGKTLVGYAAMFDSLSEDLGGFREIIRKGAFDATLASKPDVSARIQHAGGLNTIGRTTNGTLRLGVDKKGLKYEVDLPDTTAARDIHALVKRGDINKSSFAFSLRYDGDSTGERWVWEPSHCPRITQREPA